MVKQGYKETPIGIIPEDWIIKRLGDCVSAPLSYGINAPAVPYTECLPKYLRITDITEDGRYSPDDVVSVDISEDNPYWVKENDIVLARTGASTGKSYLYRKKDGKFVYAGFLIKASISTDEANAYYIFSQLHTHRYNEWVAATSPRSGQPGINSQEYSSYLIPMPSDLSEQNRIAEALSDIDNLIENTEKLIEKKKAIKQGVMQELLTGKRRLPGFSDEWEEKPLASIAVTSSGGTPSRSNSSFYTGNICWVTTSELRDNYIFETLEHITEEAVQKSSAKIFPKGTLLVAMYGATIGKLGILQTDAATNQACCAIMPLDSMDTSFLYYWFLQNRNMIIDMGCGAGQPNISQKLVKSLNIKHPALEEQQAISSILRDLDSEIVVLEKKLQKLIQAKSGMISKLLTGEIRLVE
jgi:type I restriction enzyme S subunit